VSAVSWGSVTAPPAAVCTVPCRASLDLQPGEGGALILRPVTGAVAQGALSAPLLNQLHAAYLAYAVGSDAARAPLDGLVQDFPPDLGLPGLAGVGSGACATSEGCSYSLPLGSTYTVEAVADEHRAFAGWTGPGCAA